MKVSAQTQIAILITVVLLSAINLNAQNTAQTTEPQSKFVGEISALAQNAKVRRRFRQGFSLQANIHFRQGTFGFHRLNDEQFIVYQPARPRL